MAIRIVRLGSPREPGEGIRIGTVRRPPRGVRKEDFASKDFFDLWFPNLSPSAELVKEAQSAGGERAWSAFKKKFRAEMSRPDAGQGVGLARCAVSPNQYVSWLLLRK